MRSDEKVILKMSMFRDINSRNEFVAEEVITSDEALVTYTALRIVYDVKLEQQEITTTELLEVLGYDTTKRLQREKNKIKVGLEILANNGVISYEKKGNKYIVDTTGLYVVMQKGGDLTFSVPIIYINELAQQNKSFVLIHHYLLLCSTINAMQHYGERSQEWFRDWLGYENIQAIGLHHKLFEELGLIVFSRNRQSVDMQGNFINIPKLYALPQYKDVIEKICDKQLNKTIKNTNKEIKKQIREAKKENNKKKQEMKTEKRSPFQLDTDLVGTNDNEVAEPRNKSFDMPKFKNKDLFGEQRKQETKDPLDFCGLNECYFDNTKYLKGLSSDDGDDYYSCDYDNYSDMSD